MENGHGAPRVRIVLQRFLAQLPHFCCFCHRKTDTAYDLCRFCQFHLPLIVSNSTQKCASSVCLRCGFVWEDTLLRAECAHCVNYRTVFDRIVSPYRYHFPIDGIIQRLKYQDHLASGRLLGSLLAREVTKQVEIQDYPDVILPVPMHANRLRQRGFNHAAEIARWCGHSLSIPSAARLTQRRFDTGSLVGLSRAERGLQIRGVFSVAESLQGRTVAIVDDVLTTGATAGELATELLDTGVKSVQLWAVARTAATGTAGGS